MRASSVLVFVLVGAVVLQLAAAAIQPLHPIDRSASPLASRVTPGTAIQRMWQTLCNNYENYVAWTLERSVLPQLDWLVANTDAAASSDAQRDSGAARRRSVRQEQEQRRVDKRSAGSGSADADTRPRHSGYDAKAARKAAVQRRRERAAQLAQQHSVPGAAMAGGMGPMNAPAAFAPTSMPPCGFGIQVNTTTVENVTIPASSTPPVIINNVTIVNGTFTPAENTTEVTTTSRCVCPADRVGDACENLRTYRCSIHVDSPARNCRTDIGFRYGMVGAFQPPCYQVDRSSSGSTLDLSFRVLCDYLDRTGIDESDQFDFEYIARRIGQGADNSTQHAYSEEFYTTLNVTAVNMMQLHQQVFIGAEQDTGNIAGVNATAVSIPWADLEGGFIHANRVHLEVRLEPSEALEDAGMEYAEPLSVSIDIGDPLALTLVRVPDLFYLTVGIVVAVSVVLIGIGIVYFLRATREDHGHPGESAGTAAVFGAGPSAGAGDGESKKNR